MATNEISRNFATGKSKQNSVVGNNNIIVFHQQEMRSFLSLPEHKHFPMPETNDFLSSLFPNYRQSSCQLNGLCLPGFNLLDDQTRACIKEQEWPPPASSQFCRDDFDILKQWLGNTDHRILMVVEEPVANDQANRVNKARSTKLMLEILYLEPTDQLVHFSAHICEQKCDGKEGWRQEVLIMHLLGQLIERYKDRFDGIHACPRLVSTIKDKIKIEQLLDLFIKCVKQAGIQKLVIVLDQIHHIFSVCVQTEQFGEFVEILETICETLWNGGVIVKIMVTSKLDIAACFKNTKAFKKIVFLAQNEA
ncbi:hypothetical protein F4806DRAFT_339713 [Annulohypoxylon nitens]|nr:hypothetical protein F4806DRAFT_339713 [Annulohypoxylon nitens]